VCLKAAAAASTHARARAWHMHRCCSHSLTQPPFFRTHQRPASSSRPSSIANIIVDIRHRAPPTMSVVLARKMGRWRMGSSRGPRPRVQVALLIVLAVAACCGSALTQELDGAMQVSGRGAPPSVAGDLLQQRQRHWGPPAHASRPHCVLCASGRRGRWSGPVEMASRRAPARPYEGFRI
jgi:hypothetical protein